MTNQEKADKVNEYIDHTIGSQNWYKHSFLPLIYTDGPALMAETCGAHWYIDLIASHQPGIVKRHGTLSRFQVWQLTKETDKKTKEDYWVARCWSDTPNKSSIMAIQKIPYSDFPDELLPFNMWVEGGTLIFPAEH